MKNRMKLRCKRMLAVMFGFALMLGVGFLGYGKTIQVQAAENGGQIISNLNYVGIKIEKNQTVNLRDFWKVADSSTGRSVSFLGLRGVTFKSDNPSVVSVSSTGVAKMCKVGEATITAIYQGESGKVTFEVVRAGALGTTKSKYDKYEKKMAALVKAYGSGITIKNAAKVSKLLNTVNTFYNQNYQADKLDSFSRGWDAATTKKLVVPCMTGFWSIYLEMNNYVRKYAPMEYGAENPFQITSISGKGSTVTIKLSKKVTAQQIFAVKYSYQRDTLITDNKKVTFKLGVKDRKTKYFYMGRATITQGSNVMTLKLNYHRLIKGHSYHLMSYSIQSDSSAAFDWHKAKQFVAK